MKTASTDPKKTTALHRRMEQTYGRYKASKLSRNAFCQAEGISLAQFTYWCQRFDKELTISPPTEIAKSSSTVAANGAIAPNPSFTQISLPTDKSTSSIPLAPATPSVPEPASVALPTPLMVLDLLGKARLEFYTQVGVEYLCTVLRKGC